MKNTQFCDINEYMWEMLCNEQGLKGDLNLEICDLI
jgi:hypothetical protein